MDSEVLKRSDLEDIHLLKRGKVRDVYEIGDQLLIVASDRMSAFYVVMADPIPDKGKVLTSISLCLLYSHHPHKPVATITVIVISIRSLIDIISILRYT